jgi:peroxiredoxin
MSEKLDTGDAFPQLSLSLAGGGSMAVPDDLGGNYAVLLFYRGHW